MIMSQTTQVSLYWWQKWKLTPTLAQACRWTYSSPQKSLFGKFVFQPLKIRSQATGILLVECQHFRFVNWELWKTGRRLWPEATAKHNFDKEIDKSSNIGDKSECKSDCWLWKHQTSWTESPNCQFQLWKGMRRKLYHGGERRMCVESRSMTPTRGWAHFIQLHRVFLWLLTLKV